MSARAISSSRLHLRLAAASVAAGALLAACSQPVARPPGDGVDQDRSSRVAADENATPAEIIQAGRAVDAARSGRSVLVAYTVHPDAGEGRSAAAWRLYDADGDTLAEEYAGVTDEGSARPWVTALPDGFLVGDQEGPWWHVRLDGSRQQAIRAEVPMAAQPGDMPLGFGSPRLFRPATRTLFTVAPRPMRNRQGWAAADDGTIWMQGPGAFRNGPIPFFRSSAGSPWQRAASYDPEQRQWIVDLTTVGDRIAFAVLASGGAPDRARLVALAVRPSAAPARQPWEMLRPPREAAGANWFDARVTAVDDTTALVGPWGVQPYLVDLTDGGWRPMDSPTAEDNWTYESEDGRIYATNAAHADAWFTDNLGESWARLPH